MPENLRSDVIRWGHCSKVACHPGVNRTIFLVKQRFWWQSMARDIRLFVLSCSVCAISKTSNRPPAGLLQPLSVPSRPWSHISLDFVTGLPPSQGNTVVLTVVDRFSKATHFIPLPEKQRLLSLTTFFAFMASRWTWFLTGGLTHQGPGRSPPVKA